MLDSDDEISETNDSAIIETQYAVVKIQSLARGFLVRKELFSRFQKQFERHFDGVNSRYFYYNTQTTESSWYPPNLIRKYEDKIATKIEACARRHLAIKHTRNLRNSKLVSVPSPIRKESYQEKPMEEWTVTDTATFVRSIDFQEYSEQIYAYKVNGLLLSEMNARDWSDLGVRNRLHLRRIQLEIERFQNKYLQQQEENLRLEEENKQKEIEASKKQEIQKILDEEGEDIDSEDLADKINIVQQLVHSGDGRNFPFIGDVVRVDYECLLEDGFVVESTKHKRKRPFEFVLGEGDVLKGFERAVANMSLGERSKFTIKSDYAYGKEGLPPLISPSQTLLFDITLLAFWARPQWIKPLIQTPGLSEKPYEPDDEELVMEGSAGDDS